VRGKRVGKNVVFPVEESNEELATSVENRVVLKINYLTSSAAR